MTSESKKDPPPAFPSKMEWLDRRANILWDKMSHGTQTKCREWMAALEHDGVQHGATRIVVEPPRSWQTFDILPEDHEAYDVARWFHSNSIEVVRTRDLDNCSCRVPDPSWLERCCRRSLEQRRKYMTHTCAWTRLRLTWQ